MARIRLWMSWAYDAQKPLNAMLDVIRELTDPCTIFWGFRRDTGAFAVATGLHEHKDAPGMFETGY